MIICNYGFSTAGICYIIWGKSANTYPNIDFSQAISASVGMSIVGLSNLNGAFGYSVSIRGDINDDVIDDIIIGAPNALAKAGWIPLLFVLVFYSLVLCFLSSLFSLAFLASLFPSLGVTYVVYGRSSLTSMTIFATGNANGYTAQNGIANTLSGYAVAMGKDINGDSIGDFLVSAPGFSTATGVVYLVYGTASIRTSVSLG
jgi:hypothetical protein